MNFHVIIPARYQSTRLPGKPLLKIGNKTMIEHVCEQAKKSNASSITVATDDQSILDCVNSAGFNAVMTSPDHVSGSDRIFEAAQTIGLKEGDVIVNVQGDEPFIPSKNIIQVAGLIDKHKCKMATLCCSIDTLEEASNPNAVKVIFDKNNKAIYFSRAQIPYQREGVAQHSLANYYRHIGIYAYTKEFLSEFVKWPESEFERTEKLEQLRAIENGVDIYIDSLETPPPTGIDTREDLEIAQKYYQSIHPN